jgi:hypothetical protein
MMHDRQVRELPMPLGSGTSSRAAMASRSGGLHPIADDSLVWYAVPCANLRHTLAVHAVLDDEHPAARRNQGATMLSTAAVPEPVMSTAAHCRVQGIHRQQPSRASSCRSKNSLSRWHRSGCNRLLRTRSVSVTGPGLSNNISELQRTAEVPHQPRLHLDR